jgi:hypothetical protein
MVRDGGLPYSEGIVEGCAEDLTVLQQHLYHAQTYGIRERPKSLNGVHKAGSSGNSAPALQGVLNGWKRSGPRWGRMWL